MPRYAYEAKKNPAEIVKGVLVADNRNAAIQKVAQLGFFLISIKEEAEAPVKSGEVRSRCNPFERITLNNITDFTRQLSDLLESGLTITKALELLEMQSDNRKLKAVIADVKAYCVGGKPLSEALARHPGVFSNLYISMIKSGETGGMLGNILKRLSDFSEKQLEIQTRMRTALAYPILMSVVGTATIVVLLTFVIPKMMVMFSDLGQALPLPTQILLAISSAIKNYWWIILAALAAAWAAAAKMYKTDEGRLAIDKICLGLPVVGALTRKIEVARFARTLATLLENGVPILHALDVVSATIGNAVIRQDIEKCAAAVKKGASLANGFAGSSNITPAVTSMIALGEEGGNLTRSLMKIAQGYERESDEAMKVMMSLLEPILILVLGAVVGFIVISMLLPIFEINFLVR
jgi:general secretion pathway protein F